MSLGNPSDISGALQHGQCEIGVVTDINDPTGNGRVKVLKLGKQNKQKITDDKQSWIEVLSPNCTQQKGVGMFPPHQFVVGTRVMLSSLGQNDMIIGALQNYNKNDPKSNDTNIATQKKHVAQLRAAGKNETRSVFGRYPHEDTGTSDAMAWLEGKRTVKWKEEDPNKSVMDNVEVAKPLGGGFGMGKGLPFNIGSFPFNAGDMTDPVKYIKSKIGTKGEIIPNALSMAQSLKEFGQKGININSILSVGGMGNITGAISGISSMLSSNSKSNQDKQNAEDLEAQLRALYKELFEKEPLNSQGLETEHYKKWKAEYLSDVDLTPYESEAGETS